MTGFFLRLDRHDERILHAMVMRRRVAIDRLMRSITHLGDAWFTVVMVLVLMIGAPRGLGRAGAAAAFTLVVSHLWVQLLKRTIIRPRPRLPVGCRSLVEAPDRFSFPSGHAAASLSIALPIVAVLSTPLSIGLLIVAGLVGLSRCYLGVHYPGDVVIGWLLAGVAAWLSGPVLVLLGLG